MRLTLCTQRTPVPGIRRFPASKTSRIALLRASPPSGGEGPSSSSSGPAEDQGRQGGPQGAENLAPPPSTLFNETQQKSSDGSSQSQAAILDDSEQVPSIEWMEEPGKKDQESFTPTPKGTAAQASPQAQPEEDRVWRSAAKEKPMEVPQGSVLREKERGPALETPQLESDAPRPPSRSESLPTANSTKDFRVPSPEEASTLGSVDLAGPANVMKRLGEDPQERLLEKPDLSRNVLFFSSIVGFLVLTGYVGYDIYNKAQDTNLATVALRAPIAASTFLLNWVAKPKSPLEVGLGVGLAGLSLLGFGAARDRINKLGEDLRNRATIAARYALVTGIFVLLAYILTRD